MRIRERQFGIARVVDCQGPLVGGDACADLRRALWPREADGTALVVVNLANVADVDCDGMLALGQADRAIRRAGGALRVAIPEDGRRPLTAERIRTLFDAFESVEDALADLRAAMARRRAAGLWACWPRVRAVLLRKMTRAGPF